MTTKDVASKKLFLFDLDGTLYLGDKLFPFTKPLLEEIKTKTDSIVTSVAKLQELIAEVKE